MTGNAPAPLDFGSLRFADLDVHALARELLDSDNVAQHGRGCLDLGCRAQRRP